MRKSKKQKEQEQARDRRVIQLVAREGMLSYMLEHHDFPTANHRAIMRLIYDETLDEMKKLGLTPEPPYDPYGDAEDPR